MATLLLRMAGPLQSWGIDSKFNVRRTEKCPSKSGVVGLLAAALGRKRDADVDDLAALKMGVRIDQPGKVIRDFHTVTALQDVTERYYLSDAVFLVGLESEDSEFLEGLKEALLHPAYPLFLGRRSCPVTLPLLIGIRECDVRTALQNEKWLAADWVQRRNKGNDIKLEIDLDGGEDGLFRRRQKDVPISYSPVYRKHGFRTVQESSVQLLLHKDGEYKGGLDGLPEHDAMSELR